MASLEQLLETSPIAPYNAQNQYTYKPNGSGGLNYFQGATPITNTQYGAATGQDYKALEAQAAKDYANS